MSHEARADKVKVTSETLIVHLVDGRKLEVPLAWFPRLCKATAAQRNRYRLIGQGVGIHWLQIDEDISIEGLLNVTSFSLQMDPSDKRQRKSAA